MGALPVAETELAVIGAGPAGLAAATAAAQAGCGVTVLDEYPSPGGQYLTANVAAGRSPLPVARRRGQALLQELARLNINLRLQTLVWGLVKTGHPAGSLHLALAGPNGPDELQARAVVIAAGGRELVIPFPGWTLPGVMTAGAAQLLAKNSGVLPGRRVLLAGAGPLLLAVAHELAGRGAEVVAVLEAGRPARWLRYSPAVWGNWDRLAEGWAYLQSLHRKNIPYRFGSTVTEALGSGVLEQVVVSRLDRQGRPVAGSREKFDVDTLCLSFGFTPNTELAQLAGCRLDFEPDRGGWAPRLTERLETSVTDLFVAGEAAGIEGAGAALVTGRLAGLAAAERLGRLTGAELGQEMAALAGQRRCQRRFGAMLNRLFRPQPGLASLVTGQTPICRCQEVSGAEIRAAMAAGADTLDALKIWTRAGQGHCQGRVCGPILAWLLAGQLGCSERQAGLFQVRPPLKPVRLGLLAAGEGK